MRQSFKKLTLLTLALVVITTGGWYLSASAERARAQTIADIIDSLGGLADLNLDNFNSVGQIGQIFEQLGGNNQALGQMADWLDVFDEMGGSIGDLQNGNLNSVGDLISGLGQIGDLGGATEILGTLSDLGANAGDLLGGNGSWSGIGDLLGSLGNISDFGNVNGVLDQIWTGGGDYSGLILQAANSNTDIGTILESGSVTMEDLAPLGLGSSGGGSSGVGTSVGQTSKEAQQDLNKERREDEKECKAEADSGGLLGGGLSGLTDLSSFDLSSLTDLGGLDLGGLSGLGGGLGGLTGGSSYVPVVEQDGDLLDLTEDTNSLTGEIKDLQVQICTHLKTIKRIQLNFEDKEFVGDVKAREEAVKQANDWQKQVFDRNSTGRTRTDGTDGGTFTPTIKEYENEKVENASKVAVTRFKNSGNAFAEEVSDLIKADEEKTKFEKAFESDISKNQFDEFADVEQAKELNTESWWRMFLLVSEPQNNPYGSALLAMEKTISEKAKAKGRAVVDFIAGGGFVPQNECVEEDSDGNCVKEKTVTPGSVNKDVVSKAVTQDIEQTLMVDEQSDINEDATPGVDEADTLEPSDNNNSNGGGNGTPTGGGQAPGGTGDNDDFDLDGILNLFDFDIDDDGVDNDNDNNNFTIPDFGFPIDWSDVLDNVAPIVTLKLTGPSLDQIYEGRSNVANIAWRALNADECTAKNNWLSASLIPNRTEAVREIGDDLDTSGSLTVYLPLTFDVRLERVRGSQTAVIGYATTTNAALTQQVTTITLNSSEVAAGDRFSLIAKAGLSDEAKITVETNVASASAVNDLLGAALTQLSTNSSVGREFDKYRITFTANQSGTAFITVTADPIYSLVCANDDKTTSKTVTVSRGD